MTGYTSGKTTKDPEPWLNRGGPFVVRGPIDLLGDDPMVDRSFYAPRPAYDNHNPILVDFRRLIGEIIDTGSHTRALAQAAWWVQLLDDDPDMENPHTWGHLTASTAQETMHARHVLSKLAYAYAYKED